MPGKQNISRREVVSALGLGLAMGSMETIEATKDVPETLEEWLDAPAAVRTRARAASLERIRKLDESIHAWVQVAPQPRIAEGPLSGIPFGAKDIMETKDLVTEYGSPIYKGRHGTEDAAFIVRLRGLGAVLMGKTHTAQFAHRTPAPTRNPRNLEHTPGGSSSGSAAAVAAGMVPFATGTQTAGSILRPASYCGITGFKPTFGTLPLLGVLQFSRSLDTLGLFTNTPVGMLRLWEAIGQATPGQDAGKIVFGVADPLPKVEPAMAKAFADTVARLRQRGLEIRPVAIRPMLDALVDETRIVMFYEGARAHEERYQQYGDKLLDVAELVREGLKIPDQRYLDALGAIAKYREQFTAQYNSTSVILVPAATGPAPMGLKSTGDSGMNAPWSALGTPAISIPMKVAGLPMGLQLTAAHEQDTRLLRVAVQVAGLLG
jgi:Asp-tRNA(Asn)/Glu-tRNA(Gln) amidotransferase A subunit family amidase